MSDEQDLDTTSSEAVGEANVESTGDESTMLGASVEPAPQDLETEVPSLFDFDRPGGLSAGPNHCWEKWLAAFVLDFNEKWPKLTGAAITLKAGPIIAIAFEDAKARLPKRAIGCELSIGSPAISTTMVMERALSVACVLQLLGDPIESFPEDRELSLIERTVHELLIKKIAASLSEAWQHKDPLTTESGNLDLSPHRSRKYEPKVAVLMATIQVTICGESKEIFWLLPQAEMEELLTEEEDTSSPPSDLFKVLMEQRAHDIPVDVSVRLGNAVLKVSQLARLEPGDVIVLNQRVSDPLSLLVDDSHKFFGWLGRSGNRQAFKVSEVA